MQNWGRSIKPSWREGVMSTEMIVFEDWERVLRETVPAEKQWEWREAVGAGGEVN